MTAELSARARLKAPPYTVETLAKKHGITKQAAEAIIAKYGAARVRACDNAARRLKTGR